MSRLMHPTELREVSAAVERMGRAIVAGSLVIACTAGSASGLTHRGASASTIGERQLAPALARENAESVRELRIGVVCYGGVSLAIYMHGVTKEIQNLVWASRWLEARRSEQELEVLISEGRVDASSLAYFRALEARKNHDEAVPRVVVDSIAGTSAGGINGVFLAKALAGGLSQRELRDLWFEKADKWQLLGGRLLGSLKLAGLALSAPFGQAHPPFRGNSMYDWLLAALDGMDALPGEDPDGESATLVPEGDPLRLFVTATDFYGYARTLTIGSPPFGAERDYQKVMEFTYGSSSDEFSRVWNPALAFAARSTSSFPGAFEPVRAEEVVGRLENKRDPRARGLEQQLRTRLFPEYSEDGADPMHTSFMDGGALDNAPFGPVIDDLTQRPPKREIGERILLYLEPDPPPPPENPDGTGRPRFYGPILRSVSSIPRFQPMAGDLWAVERHNRRAALLADVIAASREPIRASLPTTTRSSFAGAVEDLRTRRLGGDLDGLPAGYVRLRVHSVVEQLAKGIRRLAGMSEDGAYASAVWDLLHAWAERSHWTGSEASGEAAAGILEDLDVGYRVRRLQFVSDEIQQLYSESAVERRQLDRATLTLERMIRRLRALMQVESLPKDLANDVASVFDPVAIRQGFLASTSREDFTGEFLKRHAADLDEVTRALRNYLRLELERLREELLEEFQTQTQSWSDPKAVERVIVAYFGFPQWDQLLYPYQRLGNGGELRPIRVVRVSPNDATALNGGNAADKLGGAEWAHFGAFFSREAREKDYFWGRLDAVERLLGLISPEGAVSKGQLKAGFEAVLVEADRERAQLRFAAALAEEIRKKLRNEPEWSAAGGEGAQLKLASRSAAVRQTGEGE